MTAARRLAAILAADVVGYSRLMGEDEAGTAKIVRERREAATPIVRSFGGRLVKTMGDGVLLEFPSVVAAVECAIAIQKMTAKSNAAVPEAKRYVERLPEHFCPASEAADARPFNAPAMSRRVSSGSDSAAHTGRRLQSVAAL